MAERNINISITNKKAEVIGTPVIVCGNSDYTATFAFDDEWNLTGPRTARFVYVKDGKVQHTDVVFPGNVVAVPILENVDFVDVGVFAGNLCTTTPARVRCKKSILCGSGTPHDPTPDVYDQIMELFNEMAEAGAFGATEAQAQQIAKNKSDIAQLDATKAEQTDVAGLTSAVGQNSQSITKNAQDIAQLAATKAAQTDMAALEARMDTFTHLEEGSTTGDAELADIRVGYEGTQYATAGAAVRGQVGQLSSEIVDNKENVESIVNGNEYAKLYPSFWEQGRYIADETSGNVYKPDDIDSQDVKNMRCRLAELVTFNHDVVLNVASGYSVYLYILDNPEDLATYKTISWTSQVAFEKGKYYAVVLRNNSGANISYADCWNIVSFSIISDFVFAKYENLKGVRFSQGGYVHGAYNAEIVKTNSSDALPIRLRSENIIDFDNSCTVSIDKGYVAYILYTDVNNLYKGNVVLNADNSKSEIVGKFVVQLQKEDNSMVGLEDLKHIHFSISDYPTFKFESGSYGKDSNNYYAPNNAENVALLRVRSGEPKKMTKHFKIKAKEGYSFAVDSYTKDENGYLHLETDKKYVKSGSTTWLDNGYYAPKEDIYYAIVIKANDGSNVYPYLWDNYISIEYDCFSTINKPKRFKDYKVLFIGDSITQFNFSAQYNWQRLLSTILNFSVSDNQAVGGCGIVRGGSNAWYTKLDTINGDYDLVLIMGNMNDYSDSSYFTAEDLGRFGDNTLDTQYGALKLFLEKVMAKFPLAKVGWITSTPRQYLAGDDDNPSAVTTDGYLWGVNSVFEGANKAILDTCNNYSIPCLDLFHESNLQAWSEEQRAEYFYNDGNSVHPNDKGHEIMTIKILDFVARNF